MDEETKKVIRESEELSNMCKSIGWGIARERIFLKIMELNDITTITEIDPQKLMVIIAAKQEAVKILFEWLSEIEGVAKNAKELRKQFLDKQKEDFISRFGDSE
jgi:hypothetical protein